MINSDSYSFPDVTLYRLNEIKAIQRTDQIHDNRKFYYLLIYYMNDPIAIGYIDEQKRNDIYLDLKERLKNI